MKDRIAWIDTLKALGIIAIYLGHFGSDAGKMYSFVFAYHVQLFFFVSGFFARVKDGETILQFFKARFLRLMVPYFGFSLVAMIIYSLSMNTSIKTMLFQGAQGIRNHLFAESLWFFPCLFVVSIMYYVILYFVKKKGFALIVATVMFVLTQTLLPSNPCLEPSWFWNIDSAMYYIVFYAFGAVVFPYLKAFSFKKLSVYGRVGVLLFALLCIFVTIVVYVKGGATIYTYIGGEFFLVNWLYQIIRPILMIFTNIYLAVLLRKATILNGIGRYTLTLCGTEQIIKILIPTILGLFSISLNLSTPLSTFLYTLLCLIINRYTVVEFTKKCFNLE